MAPGYAGGRLMLRSGGVKSVSAVRLQVRRHSVASYSAVVARGMRTLRVVSRSFCPGRVPAGNSQLTGRHVFMQRKVQVSAVKMQEGGGEKEETYEEITARVKEEERQRQQKMQEMMAAAKQDTPYTDEEAKLYYQQNSGAGYRKNSQDGLLFAMGGMILLSMKSQPVSCRAALFATLPCCSADALYTHTHTHTHTITHTHTHTITRTHDHALHAHTVPFVAVGIAIGSKKSKKSLANPPNMSQNCLRRMARWEKEREREREREKFIRKQCP